MIVAPTSSINATPKVERTSPKQNKIAFVQSHCPKNKDAFRVDVHNVWDNNFRVNYWGHSDKLGNTIIDSKFLVIKEENGEWKFKKLHWNVSFFTSFESGWLKIPLLGLLNREDADAPAPHFHPYPSGYRLPYHYKHPITEE